MRVLLIINIVLCLFVLLIVPGLQVGKPDKPVAYRTFSKDHTLSDSVKEQLDGIVDQIIEIQREKTWHKIVLPQIACGAMLLVNIYLLVRFEEN